MKNTLLYLLAGLLFLGGFGVVCFPHAQRLLSGYEEKELILDFQEEADAGGQEPYQELRRQMEEYNTRICENGQQDLKDVWSYEQNPFDFQAAGLPDDMIGYISIEAMGEQLPLYIGANEENMKQGAVVMGQTSMPIGGAGTNCVIAAHRGYRGIPMFQYIEVLKPGDKVEISNLWETLEYQVVKSIVISPDDIEAVKIVPGADMLTLITCHPYTKNYQRYVVYCTRVPGDDAAADTGAETGADAEFAAGLPEGVAYDSSAEDIRMERLVSYGAMAVCLLCFLLAVIAAFREARRPKKHSRTKDRRRRR